MFPDRLQVRISTNGASTNVGSTATGVGDFTTLLLDINLNYTTNGYPNVWTQFTVTLSGLRLLAPRGGLPSATLSRTPGLAGLTQTTSASTAQCTTVHTEVPPRPPQRQLLLQ